jgi:hypothetical protein
MESDDIKIAKLDPEDIAVIKALEQKLGENICLVAVEKKDVIYALEAKLAPNKWQRVDQTYPQIEGLKAYYSDYDKIKDAKNSLKSYLLSPKAKRFLKKYPLRIRQIVRAQD